MEKGMNILDDKYTNFNKWINAILDKRGLESTLTIGQIIDMLNFLDEMERKLDEIVIKAFDE